MGQIKVLCHLVRWDKLNTASSFEVSLPQVHQLNLMTKTPTTIESLQNDWSIVFKGVKVMKVKGRLEKLFQAEGEGDVIAQAQ